MIAKTEITERLRATLAKELKQDVHSITPAHTLRDDLGLNSLDAIELMFKIEEEFDVSIPDEEIQKLATVGDVITYLEGRLNPPTAPAAATPPPARATQKAAPKRAAPATPKRAVPRARKPVRPAAKTAKTKGARRHA